MGWLGCCIGVFLGSLTRVPLGGIIGGIIGLTALPIERYPGIAPPTINVSTSYPGASA